MATQRVNRKKIAQKIIVLAILGVIVFTSGLFVGRILTDFIIK